MSALDSSLMCYRSVGNTGMIASVLSFGFWATFGVKSGLTGREGVDKAKKILRVARNGGINFFDNAEVYGNPVGEAETIFGSAYSELVAEDPKLWRRSDVLISTKLFWGGSGFNEKGLSRKHINEGIDASLKRLQLDYVDLVFCHRPDNVAATATVVRAMSDLVRSGKAMAWGTSEWSAQQITEAYFIAKELGCEPPQFEQPQYNMFCRERFEKEYFPLFRAPYNIGTTIWSPLASGLLSGKYNDGIPENSRLNQDGYGWLKTMLDDWKEKGHLDKIKLLAQHAKSLDCSTAQLAIAWCVKNENVSTVILGATSEEQIKENLEALQVAKKLTDSDMEKLENILGNKPDSYWGQFGRSYPTL